MTLKKLKYLLTQSGVFSGGILAHHYVSKYLDSLDEKIINWTIASRTEAESDLGLTKVGQTVILTITRNIENKGQTELQDAQKKAVETSCRTVSAELSDKVNNEIPDVRQTITSLITVETETHTQSQTTEWVRPQVRGQTAESFCQTSMENVGQKTISDLIGGKSNFVSDCQTLNAIYEYLDSLSLLKESSLLHLVFFSLILLTLFSIIGILLSNEIIKYFKIEDKYPSISTFLKIRSKYQKYYLLWNVFTLFVICIMGIGINLLVFINE